MISVLKIIPSKTFTITFTTSEISCPFLQCKVICPCCHFTTSIALTFFLFGYMFCAHNFYFFNYTGIYEQKIEALWPLLIIFYFGFFNYDIKLLFQFSSYYYINLNSIFKFPWCNFRAIATQINLFIFKSIISKNKLMRV